MAARSRETAPPPEARFVFKGTVKQLQAVTAPTIPDAEKAAIVRVDEVIQAPQLLSKIGGRDITVYLGRKKLAEGDQAIFYTTGVHFGKSIAVEARDHLAVTKVLVTLALHGRDPVKNLRARETQARMDSADMVVSGTVVAVRQPADAGTAAVTARRPLIKPSEHDPGWQEAVIKIDDMYKGPSGTETVVVRFPKSRDIMWHDAPKFHVGQRGTFILHRGSPAGEPTAHAATVTTTTAAAAAPEVYTALQPLDFHPVERGDVIRPLLATLSATSEEQ